jgi:hypothetical protein
VQLNAFDISLELEYVHALQDQLGNIDLLMHVEDDVFLFNLGEVQDVVDEEEHQVRAILGHLEDLKPFLLIY